VTTETKRPGAQPFNAFEKGLQIIESLRPVVAVVRRQDLKIAQQIVHAASSVAANVAEGNRREGKDRLHFFRIAAGSASETRAHLQVALAWGWLNRPLIERPLALIDHELAILWRLTHP
jgi:four helix bundle protein